MKGKTGVFILTVLILSLSLSLFLTSFVSAQTREGTNLLAKFTAEINPFIEKTVDIIEPIAKQLLGETPSGELLFAKVLFFIIILAIIWVALSRVDFFAEYTWVLVIVSISTSILATRFLASEALIQTIILPYSTIGIAISAGIPFVLYFLIVDVGFAGPGKALIRKIAWIFFAVIFTGLWISRYELITAEGSYAGLIYPITALLALAMVVFDGTIRKWVKEIEISRIGAGNAQDAIDELKQKIQELPSLETKGIITSAEAAKRRKEYRKRLSNLMKY